jgi:hypothetical protein
MGGAFTAVADDVEAVFQNPAGLANIRLGELQLMQTQPVFDSNYYLVSAKFEGDWGLAWSQQTMTGIALTATTSATATSDVLAEGYSTYVANALTIAKAISLSETLSLGISAAGFYQDFSGISYGKGYGAALSLGLLWKLAPELNLGVLAKDLVNRQRWDSGTWEQAAPEWRLGLAGSLQPWWDICVESRWRQSAVPPTFHAGSEWRVADVLALRMGYDDAVITSGLGVHVGLLKIDFSYEAASPELYAERVRVGMGLVF